MSLLFRHVELLLNLNPSPSLVIRLMKLTLRCHSWLFHCVWPSPPYPIKWESDKFITVEERPRPLVHLLMFVTVPVNMVLLVVYFILLAYNVGIGGDDDEGIEYKLVSLFLLVAMVLGVVTAGTSSSSVGELFAVYFREAEGVHQREVAGAAHGNNKSIVTSEWGELGLGDVGCVLSMLGMLMAAVLTTPGIPFFAVLLDNLDPVYPYYQRFVMGRPTTYSLLLVQFLRLTLLLLTVGEIWKTISQWSLAAYTTFTLRNEVLRVISSDDNNNVRSFLSASRTYARLRILNAVENEVYIFFIPVMLTCGLWIIVMCSASCVVLHYAISLPFLLILLGIDVAAVFIALTLIPRAIHAYEDSKLWGEVWGGRLAQRSSSTASSLLLSRKVLLSCRPLRVNAGSPFFFKFATRRTFWQLTISYAVNLSLSYSNHHN